MILMESNPIFLICELLVILTFNTSWFIDNICNVVLLLTAELMFKFFNNITDDFTLLPIHAMGILEHLRILFYVSHLNFFSAKPFLRSILFSEQITLCQSYQINEKDESHAT